MECPQRGSLPSKKEDKMKKHDHMTPLRVFSSGLDVVPAIISWYISELGESMGKQELFTKQALRGLRSCVC